MGYVTALFAMPARMLRPTRGWHTSPYGYFRELFAELRRNRARRVRRYAENVPFVFEVGSRPEPAPFVPAPRRPADHVPVADPHALEDPDELVPGYYRDWERKEALRRVDRSRLGVAVLHTIAEHGEAA
ncbi:hypothetical protein NE857_33510 [Nocardiopsis exhalans]|uniref:Uncharacterized protein n=1 Tax=Nocardiopsis exhalans TaxID=163604 RepID=A0ABY5D7Y9_9ACTN|nr:hypothetical protein [Nocardiopsis exhalans]USY20085.1 hypothetical protein NE857_33510 [Nocardiopsis exhalans]